MATRPVVVAINGARDDPSLNQAPVIDVTGSTLAAHVTERAEGAPPAERSRTAKAVAPPRPSS
ncbi:hypothetical protein [Methylobacterium sp. ID0610]|uniref:hypothetical protein n=1 Tax=Methylobacterium carpenticola TaxID=3344827 RepID=UPI0036B6747F